MVHEKQQFRLLLCGHKAVEAAAVCMFLMVQGDLGVATLVHLSIATKTGLVAVLPALVLTFTRHARYLVNRWFSSAFLGVCTFLADSMMHASHYPGAWTEAALTGAGAFLFSVVVSYTAVGGGSIGWPRRSSRILRRRRRSARPVLFSNRQNDAVTQLRRSNMPNQSTRREVLKGGLAIAGLGLLGIPDWALPAFAQGETLVPFTDYPAAYNPTPTPVNRSLDLRKIDGPFTPRDQFFTTQHYGHPQIDPAAFRLKVSGLVNKPLSLSLDDLRRMGGKELIAGFECSGNSPRGMEGLASNGRWTGVALKTVLDQAGVKPGAREFIFFGADHGEEEVEFRNQKFKVDQNFGRSLPRDKALSLDLFLAYAMNGEPLSVHQGFPLRLLVPGWYGVANVKWLSRIHLQEEEYLGKFQARWYRTLRGEMIDGEMTWKETSVTHMQLKSVVARVTRDGSRFKVLGFVLNDGTSIKTVEVKIDDGAWQPATLDSSTSGKYSWKFFTYNWNSPSPGEHTIVSRVTDVTGRVQPTAQELENKKTFLEDNSQFPRKVLIS